MNPNDKYTDDTLNELHFSQTVGSPEYGSLLSRQVLQGGINYDDLEQMGTVPDDLLDLDDMSPESSNRGQYIPQTGNSSNNMYPPETQLQYGITPPIPESSSPFDEYMIGRYVNNMDGIQLPSQMRPNTNSNTGSNTSNNNNLNVNNNNNNNLNVNNNNNNNNSNDVSMGNSNNNTNLTDSPQLNASYYPTSASHSRNSSAGISNMGMVPVQQQQMGSSLSPDTTPYGSPTNIPVPTSSGASRRQVNFADQFGSPSSYGSSLEHRALSPYARSPLSKGVISRSLDEKQQQLLAAAERKRKRRESHNAVERRRRDNINDRIQELSTLIPENFLNEPIIGGSPSLGPMGSPPPSQTPGTKDGRPNKGTILIKSVEYIKKLQTVIDEQNQREIDMYERLNILERQLGIPETKLETSSAELALARLGIKDDLSPDQVVVKQEEEY
ncbi:helix-loop-helix DNA-binding domain-domain-containing protein [Yarrowia lipolytica]|jgi:hypothetical protein|uniref:Helix-loop-helix DNA-binding domain-domain-containing protein n=1 Tax=Yarrowia lipolytica TaxID=4952 RepID=A0A371CC57_YARLL|nr:Retrograde regulation protein 1 [Yarrowia lipolytica]RDW27884.1 helix-loop-helix DNA-binding domain-domain-containing protein [Yarrowia lipolytica]RDW33996.1 helix-loop-helix DNA-binding domain-domain-containing protein [Yarrowia lipolytica]RDW41252.1 helix-loop-helix DNA-binding domain-domain-containing protein [Yarrowia lipolytica]RDW46948.1 helix-loop-helix DNA-binding domain-domain-containing protein [Yarrowia lipolytica]